MHERDISRDSLLHAMEAETPFDEDQALISFGPHFGGEAQQTFLQRLGELGFIDSLDLYYLPAWPDWVRLYATISVEDAHA